MYSQSCITITATNFRTFFFPGKILHPSAITPTAHNSPHPQATANLLSVPMDLPVLNLHINGII